MRQQASTPVTKSTVPIRVQYQAQTASHSTFRDLLSRALYVELYAYTSTAACNETAEIATQRISTWGTRLLMFKVMFGALVMGRSLCLVVFWVCCPDAVLRCLTPGASPVDSTSCVSRAFHGQSSCTPRDLGEGAIHTRIQLYIVPRLCIAFGDSTPNASNI